MTAEPNQIADRLAPLCLFLESEIKAELKAQGHVATGTLLDSIKVVVMKTAYGNTIEGRAATYAKYVYWGRKPGGKRVPFNVLLSWVQLKGLATGKKAESIAWAMQYVIWKNGIPSDIDKRKTGFVTNKLTGYKDRIFKDVREAVGEFYAIELNNIIRGVKELEYGK